MADSVWTTVLEGSSCGVYSAAAVMTLIIYRVVEIEAI